MSKNTTKAEVTPKVKEDIEVARFAGRLYAIDSNGNDVERIREVNNPEVFRAAGVQVYSKPAAKGKQAGARLYAVPYDVRLASRKSAAGVKEDLKAQAAAMKAAGKSEADIFAELFGL